MPNRTMAQVFRTYAAQEQAYADEARFPSARAIHEAAARKWLLLAERAERPGATGGAASAGEAAAAPASGPAMTAPRPKR